MMFFCEKEIIMKLQKFPNLIEPTNKRIKEVLAEGLKVTTRYIRFILNEDVITYDPAKKSLKSYETATNSDKLQIQWKRFLASKTMAAEK
jgi:hypothetical protein